MDNEDPPALKRPRTREDFYLFCTYVLEHENYNRQLQEESRQSTSPLDSAGLVSDSNLSSGQEDGSKPTDEDTGQYSNYVDSESYDLVTCYCNKPFAGRPMIECSNCLTWVHLSCAKIRKKHIPEVFYCAMCKSSGNLNSSGALMNGNSAGSGGSGSNSPSNNSTSNSATQFVPINPPTSTQSAIAVVVPPNNNQTATSSHKTHRNFKNMKITSTPSTKSYKNSSPTSPTLDGNNGITRVRGTGPGQFSHVKLSHIGGKSFKPTNINRISTSMTSHQKSTPTTAAAGGGGGYKRTPHS